MAIIRSHSTISQIKANKYASRLKKIIDQKKLKTSCIPYTVSAVLVRAVLPDINIKYEAIPISINSILHTTGKSQPDGESGGLLMFSNSDIESRVKNADTPPVIRGIAIQIISFFQLIFKKITP